MSRNKNSLQTKKQEAQLFFVDPSHQDSPVINKILTISSSLHLLIRAKILGGCTQWPSLGHISYLPSLLKAWFSTKTIAKGRGPQSKRGIPGSTLNNQTNMIQAFYYLHFSDRKLKLRKLKLLSKVILLVGSRHWILSHSISEVVLLPIRCMAFPTYHCLNLYLIHFPDIGSSSVLYCFTLILSFPFSFPLKFVSIFTFPQQASRD